MNEFLNKLSQYPDYFQIEEGSISTESFGSVIDLENLEGMECEEAKQRFIIRYLNVLDEDKASYAIDSSDDAYRCSRNLEIAAKELEILESL